MEDEFIAIKRPDWQELVPWHTTEHAHIFNLSRYEVHVWRAKLPLKSDWLQYGWQWLSQEEKEKANRFKFQSDGLAFITSHVLLRYILAGYMAIRPTEVVYSYNTYGKPYLSAKDVREPIYFNMSHTDDQVLFALSRSYEVGADIERVKDNFKWTGIVSHICSPQEQVLLDQLPEEQGKEMFYIIWTLKEAYLKALGTGLSGLNKDLTVISNNVNTSGYTLLQLRLDAGCYGAVAAASEDPSFQYFRIAE